MKYISFQAKKEIIYLSASRGLEGKKKHNSCVCYEVSRFGESENHVK